MMKTVTSYGQREIMELLGPAETQYGGGTAACNDVVQAGNDLPITQVVNMGKAAGTFNFSWEMYSIKDRMIVRYGSTVLYDTGCVSGNGTVALTYSGASTQVSVEVVPNCDATTGTAWDFTVSCPL